MSTPPEHSRILTAISALEFYYHVWAQSQRGEGTDIGDLWDVATQLRNALDEMLDRLRAAEPHNAAWMEKALAGLDVIAFEYLFEANALGEIIDQIGRLSEERLAALPDRLIMRLLEHEDHDIRLATIRRLGDRAPKIANRSRDKSRGRFPGS